MTFSSPSLSGRSEQPVVRSDDAAAAAALDAVPQLPAARVPAVPALVLGRQGAAAAAAAGRLLHRAGTPV